MPISTLQEQFGHIDIYLFDQLLKGRISPGMRILDAGCGSGRNLVYFLRQGSPAADATRRRKRVRALARLAPIPSVEFRVGRLNDIFDDACADMVVSNAVLHLPATTRAFETMPGIVARPSLPGMVFRHWHRRSV